MGHLELNRYVLLILAQLRQACKLDGLDSADAGLADPVSADDLTSLKALPVWCPL